MATSLENLLVSADGETHSLIPMDEIWGLIRESRIPWGRSKGMATTKGGYEITHEGYTQWVEDVITLLSFIADQPYEHYQSYVNNFIDELKDSDPLGHAALVGTVYHTPEEQVIDIQIMVEGGLDELDDGESSLKVRPKKPQNPPPDDARPPRKKLPDLLPSQPELPMKPPAGMPDLEHEQPVWLEPRHPGSFSPSPRPSRTLPSGDGTWEGANWGRPQHQHHPDTYPKVHSVLGAGFDRLIGSPDADLPHTRGMWGAGGIQSNSDAAKELWEDTKELGGQVGEGIGAVAGAVGEEVKEFAGWAYEGRMDVLNGLWKPFGDRTFGLLSILGDNVIPVLGKTTAEEYSGMWNALRDIHGERAGFLMDHPAVSPFPDGLGLFVVYKNANAEREAIRQASDYGIGIDPQKPDQWEPLGLRAEPTPYKIPGVDTNKYKLTTQRKTSSAGALNNMFDSLFGSLHYGEGGNVENPELRTAVREGDPQQAPSVHSYMSPFPEANYYNPQFQSGDGADMAHPVGEGWAGYEGRLDVGDRLLYLLGEQESDSPSSGESYDVNTDALAQWLDAKESGITGRALDEFDTAMGKYQIKPSTWVGLVRNWDQEGRVDIKNDYDQEQIARWEINDLLDRYQGDIGAVAAEWYVGRGTANKNYPAGTDVTYPDPNPSMMEYARDVVRAYHFYSATNMFQSPEDLYGQGQTLVPYDPSGNPLLWESTRGPRTRAGGYE